MAWSVPLRDVIGLGKRADPVGQVASPAMKDDLRKLENIGECQPRKQLNLGPKLPLFGWRRSVGPERNGLNATDLHPSSHDGSEPSLL